MAHIIHDQLQPGCGGPPVQIVAFLQFDPGHALQHVEDRFCIDLAFGDGLVAVIARLKDKVIGLDGIPKALIVHWFEPFFNVVYVFKSSHVSRIARADSAAQISPADVR